MAFFNSVITIGQRAWSSMIVLIVMEMGLVVITCGAGVIEFWMDEVSKRLSEIII